MDATPAVSMTAAATSSPENGNAYSGLSFWHESLGPEALVPRAPLAGDTDADVAIVGGGLTGLWTAWYLLKREPGLKVVVLEKLLDLPIVGDVRGDGYFFGIELVKDKATKATFDDDESERLLRGFLSKALFDAGLYCRADDRGDPVVQLAPPLTIGPKEFDEIESILRGVLSEAWTRL